MTGTCSFSHCRGLLPRLGSGGPNLLQLERYVEALSDPSSGLTYPALTGARKQSVVDDERLFNPDLRDFMLRQGYLYGARYIETVWNWRRACDERDLRELQRCRFNYTFLNNILEELMAHLHVRLQYTRSEQVRSCCVCVCVCVGVTELFALCTGVLTASFGFSRETLVAVIANIESREWLPYVQPLPFLRGNYA